MKQTVIDQHLIEGLQYVLATWIIRSKILTFSVVCFLFPPILLLSKDVVSWYVSHASIEGTT
jgi:hypothetical protein